MTATTTGLRARKKAQLREAIDARACVPATQGFDGTTVDAIAEACNVSATTVFRYFPTKEDIVSASAARDGDKLVELLAQQPEDLEPAPTLYRALQALCDEYVGNKATVAKNQRMVENSSSLAAKGRVTAALGTLRRGRAAPTLQGGRVTRSMTSPCDSSPRRGSPHSASLSKCGLSNAAERSRTWSK